MSECEAGGLRSLAWSAGTKPNTYIMHGHVTHAVGNKYHAKIRVAGLPEEGSDSAVDYMHATVYRNPDDDGDSKDKSYR